MYRTEATDVKRRYSLYTGPSRRSDVTKDRVFGPLLDRWQEKGYCTWRYKAPLLQ